MGHRTKRGNIKTKVKLLLVNAINSEAPDRLHPPLGLAYIAASLRKGFGNQIECRIIDGNLVDEIKTFQPDIVGITSVSRNYNIAKEYAAVAKQAGLPVIIGGIHISVLPETMTSDMDVAVIGEGEETIKDLIGWFMVNGHLPTIFNGIAYHKDGEIILTDQRGLIKPIDNIPFPARDLLNIGKHASMLTSRGCPYNCAFCSTSRFSRNQVRYHSAAYVAEEIELVYKDYKPEYITIYDDLFAMDTKRVIEIHKLLAAKNLIGKIDFATNIRADCITGELAEVFHQMNFKAVAIGVESGCQKTLNYLKSGGITVEDNARAVQILKKHHITPYCIFIIGSPDETLEDMMETIKFIKDNNIRHYDVNVLTPFPVTPVWDYALSRGLVSNDMDWSNLDYHINKEPIILSEHISRQDMEYMLAGVATRREIDRKWRSLGNVIKHPYKYVIKPRLRRLGICH